MPYAYVNGLKVHYLEEGEGLPLIFLHGFTADSSLWNPQIAHFSKRYRAIAPDFRGHGRSDRPRRSCSLEDLEDDLDGLFRELGIDEAALCGLSLGGMVAQLFALDNPRNVRALILANTMSSSQNPISQGLFDSWSEGLSSGNLEEFFEGMLPYLFDQEFLSSFTGNQVVAEWRSSFLKLDGKALSQVALSMKGLDTTKRLERIGAPTLIIVGDKDRLTPLALSRRIHERMPNSQLAIIEGATHLSNMSRMKEFNDVVGDFLRRAIPWKV